MKRNKEIKIPLGVIILFFILIIETISIISFASYNKEDTSIIATNDVEIKETTTVSNEINTVITNNNEENAQNELDQEINDKQIQNETFKKESTSVSNKENNSSTKKKINGKGYTSIGLINIPSLKIKYKILSKTSESLLKISINKYWGADPNEVGNMCLVGHNYKDSRFFGNLPKIKKGAKIYITDLEGKTLTYTVYKTAVVSATDTKCTSQETNGKKEVTLITCYYTKGERHASKRFIAKARN